MFSCGKYFKEGGGAIFVMENLRESFSMENKTTKSRWSCGSYSTLSNEENRARQREHDAIFLLSQ